MNSLDSLNEAEVVPGLAEGAYPYQTLHLLSVHEARRSTIKISELPYHTIILESAV